MHYTVFNIWYALGKFKVRNIKTLGDLREYLEGERRWKTKNVMR